MTDRPQPPGGQRPARRRQLEPAAESEPEVIVVPYRSGAPSAKLLPPILIVLVGTAFLTYRARSADWRGISPFFEAQCPRIHSPAPPLARTVDPPEPTPPQTEKVVPAADVKGNEEEKEKEKEEEKPKEVAKEPVKETPAAEEAKEKKEGAPKKEADPLEAINREAEKTRERIADLERLKENEARKLEESAEQRERAARLNRRLKPGLNGDQLAPARVARMARAHAEQVQRQMNLLAELQRRQMAAMGRDPFHFNNGGRMLVPPPPLPRNGFPDEPGVIPQLPDDLARFHVFRGPGGPVGAQVFRFQFREGRGLIPDDDDTPPPPPPMPRRFD